MDKLEMWLSKKEQGSAMQEQHFVCYGTLHCLQGS